MDFRSKNFAYVTKAFGQFMDQVDSGMRLYLRSLSTAKPSELPADFASDFPSVAKDFRLPPELAFVSENAHSSPLRISGPVIMWLHYDVNLYFTPVISRLIFFLRSWRMYLAKFVVLNVSSYSLRLTSSISTLNQERQAALSTCSTNSKTQALLKRILMRLC